MVDLVSVQVEALALELTQTAGSRATVKRAPPKRLRLQHQSIDACADEKLGLFALVQLKRSYLSASATNKKDPMTNT